MGDTSITYLYFGFAIIFLSIGIFPSKNRIFTEKNATAKDNIIVNTSCYKKEKLKMWFIYSLFYWLAGFIEFLGYKNISYSLIFISCIPGVIFLISSYIKLSISNKTE